jgi:hypothetical protein
MSQPVLSMHGPFSQMLCLRLLSQSQLCSFLLELFSLLQDFLVFLILCATLSLTSKGGSKIPVAHLSLEVFPFQLIFGRQKKDVLAATQSPESFPTLC